MKSPTRLPFYSPTAPATLPASSSTSMAATSTSTAPSSNLLHVSPRTYSPLTSHSPTMNTKDAIKIGIDVGRMISMGYIEDLSDQELLHRPAKGANHINWQLGHLIQSENEMMNIAIPGCMPSLPAGFAEQYSKDTAPIDDGSQFLKKDELLKVYHEQRAGTLQALAAV